MSLPNADNIPELYFNFEGLNRHSFLAILLPEAQNSDDERKLRSWLLHTLVSSARHYNKARELVFLQNTASHNNDGGTVFHVLDLSEHMEDCISATYRACMAVRRMSKNNDGLQAFVDKHLLAIEKLSKIRNQFEHMHSQIVSGEVGSGPISITYSDGGTVIQFRKQKLKTALLYELIRGLYFSIASLYPRFDPSSKPEKGGPMKLTVSAEMTYESGRS